MATATRQRNAQGQFVKAEEDVVQEEKKVGEPTRDHRWQAIKWYMTETNIVPVAWGATAQGKTVGAHALAEELDAELISVLLEHFTPDDVCGFQTIVSDKLVAAMPFWWDEAEKVLLQNRNMVIFFDELGLSQESVQGSMLTFLRDRMIHGKVIGHDLGYGRGTDENGNEYPLGANGELITAKVYLLAATNPAVFSPTMMTRTALIHIPADREYLRAIAGDHDLAKEVANTGRIEVQNPSQSAYDNSPPPAHEIVTAAAIHTLTKIGASFYRLPAEVQDVIVQSMLPRETAEKVLRKIRSSFDIDIAALMGDPDLFKEALTHMTPQKATSTIITAVMNSADDPDLTIRLLINFFEVATKDTKKLLNYYNMDKPQEMIDIVNKLNPYAEKMHDMLKSGGFLWAENNELKGTFIEELKKSPDVTCES